MASRRQKSERFSHLPLESEVLIMLVPMDSINISATPSLSFMLKHTTERPTTFTSHYKRIRVFNKKKTLHSTVQRTERVALNLLEHLLIQQHLHTGVVS